MKRSVMIIICVVAVLVAGVIFLWNYIQAQVMDKDGMVRNAEIVRVYYESVNNTEGRHLYIDARRDSENNYIKMKISQQDNTDEPESITEYNAMPELFDKVKKIVLESDLWTASQKSVSDTDSADETKTTMVIYLKDGDEIKLSSQLDLSAAENTAWKNIVTLLQNDSYMIH